MPDIGGAATFPSAPDAVAALRSIGSAGELSFGEFEAKRTRGRIGLDQFQLKMLTDAVRFTAFLAH